MSEVRCFFCEREMSLEHAEGCPRSREATDYPNEVRFADVYPPKGRHLVTWYGPDLGFDIATGDEGLADLVELELKDFLADYYASRRPAWVLTTQVAGEAVTVSLESGGPLAPPAHLRRVH